MYFDQLSDIDLIHDVEITFNTARKDSFLNRYKTITTIDISSYRKTLESPNEKLSSYKHVPDELKKIREKISIIADEMTRPRRKKEYKRRVKEKKSSKK